MARRNGSKVSKTLQVLMEMRDSLKEIRGEMGEVRTELGVHRKILIEHGTLLADHSRMLAEHGRILVQHGELLSALVRSAGDLNTRIDNVLLGPHRDEHEDLKHRVERLEKRLGVEG